MMNEPQPFPVTPKSEPRKGLGIASLVLGILSFTPFLCLTGVPAIITGHIARSRAKKEPQNYGGGGMALAGLILGYVSVPFSLVAVMVAAAVLIPAFEKAKRRGPPTGACIDNLKQIGLAARIYSHEHNDVFPPNIVTMSNELGSTKILVCPDDRNRTPAVSFAQFDPAQNVSYEFLTPGAQEPAVLTQISFRCPIHGNIGMGDGSVRTSSNRRR